MRNIYIILFLILNLEGISGIQRDSLNTIGNFQLLKESSFDKNIEKSEAMLKLNKALDFFLKENNMEGLAQTFLFISDYYLDENQLDTSLSLSLRALQYGDQLNDSLIKAKVFLQLGVIYFKLKSYSISKSYSQKAILYGNKRIKASAIANIGMGFLEIKQIDTAFSYFNQSNQLFLLLKDSNADIISNIAIINMNMGAIAFKKRDFADAKKYFNQSLINCYSIKDYNSIVLNYLNFGNVFVQEKKYNLAEEMVIRAKSISDSIGLYNLKNLSILALSEIYYSKRDYQRSYNFLRQYINVKDSLTGIDIENKIANLQMKYEVEKQQQQIGILKKDKKLNTYKTILIIVIILLFSSIIIVYLNKRKAKIRVRMLDIESNRKETLTKLEKAKEDIIYFTKLVQENNERIECFEKELIENTKVNTEELQKKQEKLRNMKILKDEDWVYYKNLFKEVETDFYNKVISIPNLTEGDKRQILLLKLNFTNKMSADVLGISTEGIKRARQRLSKKLKLEDAGKLEDYFLKI